MSTLPGSGNQSTLVHRLATLLRNYGDCVLDGSSTLTLQAAHLQHLTRLFEQHLVSRTNQHGFLALPSHPADTASLLQVQGLFDMLQKTLSLKLVIPAGSRLQSVVKIFPFKSLKHLELKRIPPHCLEGLRGVYSQLEIFTCSKSLTSLEELLSLCGGDLSSALPWLELHTLNFSYNSITCLDDSLSLLNVLRSLDLSHNRIQDCAEFLKPLSELEYLNISYNNLQRAPQLGPSARIKLSVLVLRNNELETINGLEHLSSLQHLDLAYNLLLEHSQLAPLSQLHTLHTLILEGNPLFFLKTHRACTVRHLSPRAAFQRLRLDGCPLSTSELSMLPKPGQLIGQMVQAPAQVAVVAVVGGVMGAEPASQDQSSGAGELSDSVSVSEAVAVSRLRKRKSKGKVRVRRASISEPSDTDHEVRVGSSLQDTIVLHHQKDIERMDSFRDKLGEDWLRYQHHLEPSSSTPPQTSTAPTARTSNTSTPAPAPASTLRPPTPSQTGVTTLHPSTPSSTSTSAQHGVSTQRTPSPSLCDGPYSSTPNASTVVFPVTPQLVPNGRCTPTQTDTPVTVTATATPPPQYLSTERTALADALCSVVSPPLAPLSSNVRDGVGGGGGGGGDVDMDTESTLRWDRSTASTLEERSGTLTNTTTQSLSPRDEERNEEEEEEDDTGVDLCLPLLVGVAVEDEECEDDDGGGGDDGGYSSVVMRKSRGPLFLRVRQGVLLEVDMTRGRVRRRVEMDNLHHMSRTHTPWGDDKEQGEGLPSLTLHFSSLIRHRRQRCYVMLDDNPQQALQDLWDILSRVVEENMRRAEGSRPAGMMLKCLRCRAEFPPPHTMGTQGYVGVTWGPERSNGDTGGGVEEKEAEDGENTNTNIEDSTGSGVNCPECNSDHVVQLAGQSAPLSSTPIPSDAEEGGEKRRFSFSDTDTPKKPSRITSSQSESSLAGSDHLATGEPNTTFLTASSSLSQPGDRDRRDDEDYGWADQSTSQPISYHTADGAGETNTDLSCQSESQDEQELGGSYSYGVPQVTQDSQLTQGDTTDGACPVPFDLLCEDYEAVDHRLKLFLDVEVFQAEEELHSFLKMSTVKFGDPVEFPSLLVVTDQALYILHITAEPQGQPSDWLEKRHRHRLCEMSYLEIGLGSQSMHLEFADTNTHTCAYTLLVRDPGRCKRYFSHLTGIVRELAPRSDSKLKGISTTRLTPAHHLWPMVCEGSQGQEDEDDSQPQFIYTLAFINQDDSVVPVTVLATRETLYMLDEDHQWSKSQQQPTNENAETDSGRVTVRETQPISCVSSVQLFSSNACRLDVKLYDEVLKQECVWRLQMECVECVTSLLDWVRRQWEAMFGVKLTTHTS
ncbi:serine/threonine-protein kinase 11-interacting protein [Engraulis encrasicolus]|uniref:serine/threonine-protein kinase 11-interacting protein n=1 Tax=Engraulis encrasicolus TaxID=184585 RepID=UPI002FD6741F